MRTASAAETKHSRVSTLGSPDGDLALVGGFVFLRSCNDPPVGGRPFLFLIVGELFQSYFGRAALLNVFTGAIDGIAPCAAVK